MRVLMVGDVVGKPGRQAVQEMVPRLRARHNADFVIVNAENSAGGLGITRDIGEAMFRQSRVDVITLGNHAWAKRDSYAFLAEELRVLRPANYPPTAPGRGCAVYETSRGPIGVIVLQGRVFMDPTDDPFRMVDSLLEDIYPRTRVVFIDFHGEATSEKQAFGWYVDGRVSAVIGTHTHVQTADERILPNGTAYLTDVGMTGPYNSVIGMNREGVLTRFTSMMPVRFEVADGPSHLCGVVIEIDGTTGHARSIERIQAIQEDTQWQEFDDDGAGSAQPLSGD